MIWTTSLRHPVSEKGGVVERGSKYSRLGGGMTRNVESLVRMLDRRCFSAWCSKLVHSKCIYLLCLAMHFT